MCVQKQVTPVRRARYSCKREKSRDGKKQNKGRSEEGSGVRCRLKTFREKKQQGGGGGGGGEQ